MPPLKTLERVFSRKGIGSRTDARGWIASGRVRVNGRVVDHPGHWVDPERDRITLDGKPLRASAAVYLLLHKPRGFVTTWRDPEGRPTVYDLVADAGMWLAPVGRLDLDTSGLLLLTNDTGFAERITNPEHEIAKTYQVDAVSRLSDEQLDRLRRGVELRDGLTQPAEVRRHGDGPRQTRLEITIREGRNRQVRRMLEAVGSKVSKLVRTAIGSLEIGGLAEGKWRQLSAEEVRRLGGTTPTGYTSGGRQKPPHSSHG